MADPNAGKQDVRALGYDEALLNYIRDRVTGCKNHYKSFFSKLPRLYDLYRGIYSGKFPQYRNSIHIPILLGTIHSDVAYKVQLTMGTFPFVAFEGYGPGDAPIARKNEALISAQMRDCGAFQKAVDFFLTADLYGTAFARHGWKKEVRVERMREYDTILKKDQGVLVQSTRFDGPTWENVDPLDAWVQPGARRIDEASWVIHRYFTDLDRVRAEEAQGMWLPGTTRKLEQTTASSEEEDQWRQRWSVYRTFDEHDTRRTEKYVKPIEVWEYLGLLPDSLLTGDDPVKMRCVAVLNGRVVGKNYGTPFWHGEIPILAYSPMPDPHYLHGTGKAEVAEKMQVASNKFMNHYLDTMDLFGSPSFLYNKNVMGARENMYLKPGRMFGIDGPVGDDTIRPLIPDLRGMQMIPGTVEMLRQFIQVGTGVSEDTVQGIGGSDRQTAREYLGRKEAVMTRLGLEGRLAEIGFVEKLADIFVALNKQFLKVPTELKILASNAQYDPVTGMPIPMEPVPIDLGDINHNYRARAIGSSQILGKSLRQQNYLTLTQVLQSNPVLVQAWNWIAWAREGALLFDFPNVDQFMVQQVPGINALAMMGGGGEPGMGIGGMPGGEGVSELEMLDPAILGAGQEAAPMGGF